MKACSRGLAAIALPLTFALPAAAHAADEEIQVYIDDMDVPGEVGLDTHVNYVFSGRSTAGDYAGAEDSLHRLRITPEFSYGITPDIEAGLYLPLTTVDHNGRLDIGGVKGRIKFVTHPRGNPDLWYGANFELGRVGHRLDVNPWSAELKGILGLRSGRWLVAGNLNVDFVVSGHAPSPATVQVATKIAYSLSNKASIGIEAYNGVGELKRLGQFAQSEQTVLAAANVSFGKWDVELGAGRGFGSSPDKMIVKMIVGIPINGWFH